MTSEIQGRVEYGKARCRSPKFGRLSLAIALVAFLCDSQSRPEGQGAAPGKDLPSMARRRSSERRAGRSLFESTFRFLQWRDNEKQGSLGTILLLAEGTGEDLHIFAVTAKHVLEAFTGDYATVELRGRDKSGTEVLTPCKVKVREHGIALYAVHPTADVAAFRIHVSNHSDITQLALSNWLATDEGLSKIGLQTGDVVYELGFPLGVAANSLGYPILRSGALAWYHVPPLSSQQILADIPVFEGSSGGPVYINDAQRVDHLNSHPWILGMVSAGLNSTLTPRPEPLGISVIVPANAMREVINSLPRDAPPALCGVLP